METLTPPPIQNAIAEQPGMLTPRVWSRYFQLIRDQVLALVTWSEGLLATTPPPNVAATSQTGTATTAARGDHTHGTGAAGGYTDEQAQDAVGTILTEGPTVEWIYDDTLPGILAQVKVGMSIGYDANGIRLQNDLTTPGVSKLYGTDGAGQRGWYDQPVAGTPGHTDEQIQDLIATTIVDSTHLNWTYQDPLNQLAGTIYAGVIGTTELATNGVTYAKIQNVTDNRLLGRSAGSAGDVQELTVGTGLTLSAGVLRAEVPSYTEGTFPMTATGFAGTAPTGTATYRIVGKVATLMLPDINATSNATTFTLTALPAALAPLALVRAWAPILDNGVFSSGMVVLSGTTITLNRDVGGTPWTASGAKGVFSPTVTYIVP